MQVIGQQVCQQKIVWQLKKYFIVVHLLIEVMDHKDPSIPVLKSPDEIILPDVNKPPTPRNPILATITFFFLDYIDAVFSTPMVLSFLFVFLSLVLSFQGEHNPLFSTLFFLIQFIPGYAGREHFDTNDVLYIYGVFSFSLFLAWSLLRVGTKMVLHAPLNFHLSFRTRLKIAILYFTIWCALFYIAWAPKDPGAIFVLLFLYVFFLIATFLGLAVHEMIRIFQKALSKT